MLVLAVARRPQKTHRPCIPALSVGKVSPHCGALRGTYQFISRSWSGNTTLPHHPALPYTTCSTTPLSSHHAPMMVRPSEINGGDVYYAFIPMLDEVNIP